MFWADRIAKEIIDSGQHRPYWVDDMFTPSGFAHIGSLRGPIVHDLVYRALTDAGVQTTFTYVFNDFDPVDGLPPELSYVASELGKPLRLAKSPEPGFGSFAEFFTKDFQEVLTTLGIGATFLSSWDMYHEGKFDDVIRIALDHAEIIQDIYQKVSGSKKRERGWLPLQVVCEQCGKLGTTRVHGWDGKTVEYTCEPDMVTWAKGCGHVGRVSPFSDVNDPAHHPGKLPWKVDWPAHWKVLGVTVEGAGKDHSSAGGSRDIARELCKDVFDLPDPFNLQYEFFLIGGKKMSSSKGLGLKGRDLTSLLPPSVGRFLFTRTDYRQAIEFDPMETMAIPDLFDEYDRCWQAYIVGSDESLGRAFVLSQAGALPDKKEVFLPRFRDIANYLQQPTVDLQKKFEEKKGSSLSNNELSILKEREGYARIWVGRYAPASFRLQMSSEIPNSASTLTTLQRTYLTRVSDVLKADVAPAELQVKLYAIAKEIGVPPKDAFAGVYQAFLGKSFGPRAAWFLLQYPRDQVITRLKEAVKGKSKDEIIASTINVLHKPEYFEIDAKVKEAYPSISIGMAFIRGVHIEKRNEELEKEKKQLLDSLSGLTTEQINGFPEVISYRTLYKNMGVDWHSRRPSPEALLRRVATGKGLYTVNTCVDAYNLVVMKHRVSVGAFNADKVKFPTVLRFAGEGDAILLLGDEKPTKYSVKELAYYDQVGGYNIDFNFRDAQRTKVTEGTKDLWINVDGVYDITPKQVEQALQESVEKIIQYCGGVIEFQGIVR